MTRVAYLVSRYPAVSHAFIQREVMALRAAGVEVDTFSLRRASDAEALSPADRSEREQTYSLQPLSPARLVADHVSALTREPGRYLSTLRTAIGRGRGARGRIWQAFYFAKAVVLRAELRRRGLRHLHVHFANAGADVAMLAERLAGGELEWSLTLHGPAEFFDVSENRLQSKLACAAWVACVSDWVRSQAMALLPAASWPRLTVVRLGVDTTEWRPSERPARPDDSPLRILNVGRLDPVKGQSVLIEAIAELRERGVEVACTIVGGGAEQEALERQVEALGLGEHVELAGPVGQDRICDFYERADVFCLPSFRESLPVVLMEALAMEVPVVATRIMGIPELVGDGESGLLVAPGRADELADALAQLAGDPARRRALGAAGRRVVERDYSLSRLARELAERFAGTRRQAPPTV